MNRIVRLSLILLSVYWPVFAVRAENAGELSAASYFEDKQRGWFWYEVLPEPIKPVKPEPKVEPPKPVPQSDTAKLEASMVVPVTDQPEPLTSAWLKQNLEKYLNKAIDEPSQENVAAFYYLQRVMMDKAERFTHAARYVVMSDPQLDESVRRPISTFAVNEANHQASVAADQALKAIAAKAGILFFFRSDCRYCHVQAPILAMLERSYGFKIYPVSLDGLPMPNGLFNQFKIDQGQAALLGVEQTPALFLMKPPKQIVPLSQGVLSLEEATSRILLAAKEAGWLDSSQYQTTQGLRATPLLLPAAGSINPSTAQNPLSLIQALKAGAQYGSTP
ncbi:conjugal transfer protein TraF [Methylomonas fluvii]|uniref:Conjugal transfer protein TraF n=1 Tax=Methylomonas fluvii TaxID=1854564 RepID=A0ABR9DGX6_9GAMM|nr:conjugal transfer protein TraF [Methylomonas fluvii]MBD9362355.1 conjugal transfer protein TraF [Methylomonas fluvii]